MDAQRRDFLKVTGLGAAGVVAGVRPVLAPVSGAQGRSGMKTSYDPARSSASTDGLISSAPRPRMPAGRRDGKVIIVDSDRVVEDRVVRRPGWTSIALTAEIS